MFKASLSRSTLYLLTFSKCFEFPGNLPPLSLLILRTRAEFDRCGQPVLSTFAGTQITPGELRRRYQMNFSRESKSVYLLCDFVQDSLRT